MYWNNALLRGSVNALTFGLGNDSVDNYIKEKSGQSAESIAYDAISAAERNGINKWWVIGPGMFLEAAPTIATLAVNPISAVNPTGTIAGAGRLAKIVDATGKALNTTYQGSGMLRGLNTAVQTASRNMAYSADPNDPEQVAYRNAALLDAK